MKQAMGSDFKRPNRRSIRLKDYDYSRAGAYFLTVCVRKRLCLFGDIFDGQMIASPAGEMVAKAWDELPGNYAGVDVDSFVLMPNHIHGVIVLNPNSVGAAPCGRPSSLTAPNPGQPSPFAKATARQAGGLPLQMRND
jgi:putative transposase